MGTLYLIRHGQASYGEADYDRLSPRGIEQAQAVGRWAASVGIDERSEEARGGDPAGLAGGARGRAPRGIDERSEETRGGDPAGLAGGARGRAPRGIDALYAGPLRRQQQTAQYASGAAGGRLPAHDTLAELAEYPAFEMLQHLVPRLVAEDPKFEQLTSAPTPRLLDQAFVTILRKWSRDEWTVDGLERVDAFVGRIRAGLDRVLRAAGAGARIACVTSAGPIGVAVGLVFGIPAERMVRTSIVIRNASITELRFRSQNFDWQPDQLSLVTFNLTAHLPAELQTDR